MKHMLVNVMVATALFTGGLFASLLATGRLNHEGVANIPVLRGLFPPAAADPQQTDDTGAQAAKADASEAQGDLAGRVAHDADLPAGQDPQAGTPGMLQRGRSIFGTVEQAADAHGGQGAADPHATEPTDDEQAHQGGKPVSAHPDGAAAGPAAQGPGPLAPTGYEPGSYFRFDGMPAGLSAEQLNEAWRRVQAATKELAQRQQVLDLREQELRDLADDIARRQTEIGKERTEVEALQQRLDERIQRFHDQVKLVRADELAGLKRNAKTLASFEPRKAAELVEEQWKTDSGRDTILRTFEVMDQEAVNEILAAMPNVLVRDLLQQRLKVVRERQPSAPSGR